MKKTRASLSKKLRFDVFKRDSFKCQYCGSTAPDVLLVIDHIEPVAAGGSSELLNLLTACEPCNSGKGALKLSDNSVLAKQRVQIEALQERREQLEMLLQWKRGLDDIERVQERALLERIKSKSADLLPNNKGLRDIRMWLRKYSLSDLLDAVDKSANHYLLIRDDGSTDKNSWDRFFSKIPRIVEFSKAVVTEPYLLDLVRIRAKLRGRFGLNRSSYRDSLPLLKRSYLAGVSISELDERVDDAYSWLCFEECLLGRIGGS